MNWRQVLLVFGRELTDTRRNKSLVASLLLGPLISMAGFVGLLYFINQQELHPSYKVAVQGDSRTGSALLRELRSHGMTVTLVTDARSRLVGEHADLAVVMGGDVDSALTTGSAATVNVISSGQRFKSGFAAGRVVGLVDDLDRRVAARRMRARDLPTGVVTAVSVNVQELTASGLGIRLGLGRLLPVLAGLQVAAAMMIAHLRLSGSNGRASEALLALPIGRLELVSGVGLGALVVALAIAAVVVIPVGALSALAVLALAHSGAAALQVVGLLLFGILLMGALCAGIGLVSGAAARGASGGVRTLSALSLLVVPAELAFIFLDRPPGGSLTFAVPILGQLLLMRDGIAGTLSFPSALMATGAAVVVTALLLKLSVRFLTRDQDRERAG